MTWKKIVQATAVSACPRCGNAVFDLESGEDLDDPSANVRCGACGHVCSAQEFSRPLAEHERREIEVKQLVDAVRPAIAAQHREARR